MSCGVGCRCGSDPELLWLWYRLAAAALIQLLAWEPPYAEGMALRRQKKEKKRKKKRKKKIRGRASGHHCISFCVATYLFPGRASASPTPLVTVSLFACNYCNFIF